MADTAALTNRYVDVGVASRLSTQPTSLQPRELYALARDSPERQAFMRLSELNGVVPPDIGLFNYFSFVLLY